LRSPPFLVCVIPLVRCALPPSFFFSLSPAHPDLHSFPTRRSSDLLLSRPPPLFPACAIAGVRPPCATCSSDTGGSPAGCTSAPCRISPVRHVPARLPSTAAAPRPRRGLAGPWP